MLPGSHTAAEQDRLAPMQRVHKWHTTHPHWIEAAGLGHDGPSLPAHHVEAEAGDVFVQHMSIFHAVYVRANSALDLSLVSFARGKIRQLCFTC